MAIYVNVNKNRGVLKNLEIERKIKEKDIIMQNEDGKFYHIK
jgi:hypothetical protein